MNELVNTLKEEWKDKETRHVYCDEFLNSSIATQIKVLREQRGLTQAQLAALASMMQPRIAAMEDVNYSSWTINVLRRLAEAFDLTLTVKFESFGGKLHEIVVFSRENLEKLSFEDDPIFKEEPAHVEHAVPQRLTAASQAGTTQLASVSSELPRVLNPGQPRIALGRFSNESKFHANR
jgi:transcriptional regulator with XRE-family HTH domain